MTSLSRPTFRDGYLSDAADTGVPAGVIRRKRNVWHIFQFGVAGAIQPREAFATPRPLGPRNTVSGLPGAAGSQRDLLHASSGRKPNTKDVPTRRVPDTDFGRRSPGVSRLAALRQERDRLPTDGRRSTGRFETAQHRDLVVRNAEVTGPCSGAAQERTTAIAAEWVIPSAATFAKCSTMADGYPVKWALGGVGRTAVRVDDGARADLFSSMAPHFD